MNLKELIKDLDYEVLNGDIDVDINGIQYDSRKVNSSDVFVCIPGFTVDGHNFAEKAVNSGANVIICEKDITAYKDVTIIKVKNTRKALAKVSAVYYNNPERRLKIIGVTGTNGKTTSVFMLKAILEKAGFKVGLIGTIANYIGDKKLKAERTTPESLELFKLFNDMTEAGVDYCVMEVSSHSLDLDRVYGIEFNSGIFTNLTQDHLDYHKTLENYFNSKAKLFTVSKSSIINLDDDYGVALADKTQEKLTYAIDKNADLKAENINLTSRGSTFELEYNGEKEIFNINIPGKYNIQNALGCIGSILKEGVHLKVIKEGLDSLKAVPGRCEIVTQGRNLGFEIIVDYAHTPDSLLKILKTAREFTDGRLISVFGCGGDRDNSKRHIMVGTERV